MVLSNKRLKQKLRAERAESLAASVAGTEPNSYAPSKRDPESESQSLKELLVSATRTPRLSKREKRRKETSFTEGKTDEVDDEDGSESLVEKEGKRRKRKRDEKKEKSEKAEEQNGLTESGENIKEVKKLNKKKNKSKKKKKKKSNEKNTDPMNEEEEEEEKVAQVGNEEQGVTTTHESFECQANGEITTKVYVGGIPYYSTEDDIRCFFESCGTITEVDCMHFPESGKFRGIAILSFKTEAAARRALAMDGADMGGLFLKIQPYRTSRANKDKAADFSPQIIEGYNRIYLGNLSWDITEDDVRKFFSDCNISSIRFGMDKDTGEFRGYAHVDFSDSVSLSTALKLDQNIVCGRPVKISCAVPARKVENRSRLEATDHKVYDSTKKVSDTGLSSAPASASTPTPAPTPVPVSGKIRRRTCYECGEKGHLSSDCPKKQTATAVAV